MTKPFRYEYTHRITEDEYLTIHSSLGFPRRPLRLAIVNVVAVACLFWQYTFLLGFVVLSLSALNLIAPRLFPSMTRQTFRNSKVLNRQQTFIVSDSELRIKGYGFDLKCTWRNLDSWHQRKGWLTLTPIGMPSLYFPVADLRKADAYSPLIDHLRDRKPESDPSFPG